jgi:hypothetical protein
MSSYCWISTSGRENTAPERRGDWTHAADRVPLGPPWVQAAAAHPPGGDAAAQWSASSENDETVLIAALEELEAQRAAIAWLVEGNLLRLCLV